MPMKYFCTETQRTASRSTCYYEFQKGRHDGRAWKEDSISLSDSIFERPEVSSLFTKAIPEFDFWGITVVTPIQWQYLLSLAQSSDAETQEIISELTAWVDICFQNEPVFTIYGM